MGHLILLLEELMLKIERINICLLVLFNSGGSNVLYLFWGIYLRSSTKTYSTAFTTTINPGVVTSIVYANAIGGAASVNVGINSNRDGTCTLQGAPNRESSGVRSFYWCIIGFV